MKSAQKVPRTSKSTFTQIDMVRRQIKHSYDMLVADCNHIFFLKNEEQNHQFFFDELLEHVGHLGKVLRSTFAENLRLLSVGFEI